MSDETLAEQSYRSLKQRILRGEFAAEDTLTERRLAEQSGISRTPLRGAISQLEKEGVLVRLQNGTLMVREVTLEQLMEIAEVRRILEGTAAARAAEAAAQEGLPPALAVCRQVMRAYVDGADTAFDDFWQDDEAFHLAVARAAGFALLPDMIAEMRQTARRCTISRTHDRYAEQASEHVAVIDAIEAGDPAAAQAAMERHFDSVRMRFMQWLVRR
ncbi:MAG: GntR family transcriptional regulator [Paracoccus sp. (in: a-proteobacteria)]|uniref:GntR family transcriptional regulator n=1 Tax=Paracoccus sp. TaxID=267 RepID=UPI0039E6E23F